MSKLASIAERLRSDNQHERAVAVTMVEKQTGENIRMTISRGSERIMPRHRDIAVKGR